MATPAWDAQEFETLLENHERSSDALVPSLPRRNAGAIDVVRQGIHAFHQPGMNTSMLSKVMVRRLEEGGVICPVCRTRF